MHTTSPYLSGYRFHFFHSLYVRTFSYFYHHHHSYWHTSCIRTHRGVTLRCHGSFGWLCVAVCVVLNNTHNPHEPSAQHTAAHSHHHIALHRIISHQVPCISPFNLIAIDDKSPCWEVWYLWSSKLCLSSCLLSAEAGASWFVIEDFLHQMTEHSVNTVSY